ALAHDDLARAGHSLKAHGEVEHAPRPQPPGPRSLAADVGGADADPDPAEPVSASGFGSGGASVRGESGADLVGRAKRPKGPVPSGRLGSEDGPHGLGAGRNLPHVPPVTFE